MFAAQVFESGNIVRIGEEPDVENKIAIGGNAVTITEAVHLHQDLLLMTMIAEGAVDRLTKLVHVELAGIDDRIGQTLDGSEHFPLVANAGGDALPRAQRMGTARFAEAADQDRVVCFEKQQPRADCALYLFVHRREALECGSLANIDDESGVTDLRTEGELGEL